MTLKRQTDEANLIDILDRILDKGIVVDAWMLVPLAGMDLVIVEARAVIASLETYLNRADMLARSGLAAAPPSTPLKQREERNRESHLSSRPRAFAARVGSQHG
jgi:hypothetical protein